MDKKKWLNEDGIPYSFKHGLTHTRLYGILQNIKQRCHNSSHKLYIYYGDKGINLCGEWANDFKSFYDWSMKNGYDDTLTLQRKDLTKDYCPDNCFFAKQTKRNLKKGG